MTVMSRPAEYADTSADVVRRQLEGERSDWAGRVFQALMLLALVFCLLMLAILIGDQISKGSGVFPRFGEFLSGTLQSLPENAGIQQGLRGTFWIGMFTVVLGFPFGIGAGLYLEEYAPENRLTRFIDVNIRNLAGVPSIVYGILGFAIFVKALGGATGGRSVIAAGITIAILVLPIIIITTAEAVRAVPQGLREAGYGVGATRWEVVRHQVMPYAAPGIITGTILALARALGEAAPLILIGAVQNRLGSAPGIFDLGTLQDRFTAMPIIITTWAGQPGAGFIELTAAASVVLLAIVLFANAGAILLRNRYESRRG